MLQPARAWVQLPNSMRDEDLRLAWVWPPFGDEFLQAWADLYHCDPKATPAQHPAWCTAFDAIILAAYRGDQLVFVLPLQKHKGALRTITGDYGGCVGDLGPDALQTLARFLRASSPTSLLDLRHLRFDSPLLPSTDEGISKQTIEGMQVAAMPHQTFYRLEGLTDYQAFQARISANLNRQLAYDMRRLGKEVGEVSHRIATKETLDQDFQTLVDLHQARWQARGKPGAFANPSFKQATRQLLEALIPHGEGVLITLRAAGKPIGALLGYRHGGTFCYLTSGIDESHAKYSPGKALVHLAIKHAIEQGDHTFDFMLGEEAYKQRWGTTGRTTHRLILAKKNIAGILGVAALIQKAKRGAKKATATQEPEAPSS
ncbi:MAG: GNAT family N-acetyltransferase [Armatimonadetes bacterium]|nr:GNAT family N-acetyltransferase [Armatimonadota bacterium]